MGSCTWAVCAASGEAGRSLGLFTRRRGPDVGPKLSRTVVRIGQGGGSRSQRQLKPLRTALGGAPPPSRWQGGDRGAGRENHLAEPAALWAGGVSGGAFHFTMAPLRRRLRTVTPPLRGNHIFLGHRVFSSRNKTLVLGFLTSVESFGARLGRKRAVPTVPRSHTGPVSFHSCF